MNENAKTLMQQLMLKMQQENAAVIGVIMDSGKKTDPVSTVSTVSTVSAIDLGSYSSAGDSVGFTVPKSEEISVALDPEKYPATGPQPDGISNWQWHLHLQTEFNRRHPGGNYTYTIRDVGDVPQYAISEGELTITDWYPMLADAFLEAEGNLNRQEKVEWYNHLQSEFAKRHPEGCFVWKVSHECGEMRYSIWNTDTDENISGGAWLSCEEAWADAEAKLVNFKSVPKDMEAKPKFLDPNEKYRCVSDEDGFYIVFGHVDRFVLTVNHESERDAWESLFVSWIRENGDLEQFPFPEMVKSYLPRAFAANCDDRWWILNTTEEGGFFQIVAEGRTRADAWQNAIRLSRMPVTDDDQKESIAKLAIQAKAELKKTHPFAHEFTEDGNHWIFDATTSETISGICSDSDFAWVSAWHQVSYQQSVVDCVELDTHRNMVAVTYPKHFGECREGKYCLYSDSARSKPISDMCDSMKLAFENAATRIKDFPPDLSVPDSYDAVTIIGKKSQSSVMKQHADARCLRTEYGQYWISGSYICQNGRDLFATSDDAWSSAVERIEKRVQVAGTVDFASEPDATAVANWSKNEDGKLQIDSIDIVRTQPCEATVELGQKDPLVAAIQFVDSHYPDSYSFHEKIDSQIVVEIRNDDKAISNTFPTEHDAWMSAAEMIGKGMKPTPRDRQPEVLDRKDQVKEKPRAKELRYGEFQLELPQKIIHITNPGNDDGRVEREYELRNEAVKFESSVEVTDEMFHSLDPSKMRVKHGEGCPTNLEWSEVDWGEAATESDENKAYVLSVYPDATIETWDKGEWVVDAGGIAYDGLFEYLAWKEAADTIRRDVGLAKEQLPLMASVSCPFGYLRADVDGIEGFVTTHENRDRQWLEVYGMVYKAVEEKKRKAAEVPCNDELFVKSIYPDASIGPFRNGYGVFISNGDSINEGFSESEAWSNAANTIRCVNEARVDAAKEIVSRYSNKRTIHTIFEREHPVRYQVVACRWNGPVESGKFETEEAAWIDLAKKMNVSDE